MKIPSRVKFRKSFKILTESLPNASKNCEFNQGVYGLKALNSGRATAAQIEAARTAIMRHMKREGQLWIRVMANIPVSSKGLGVRMGGGKGSLEYWATAIRPGTLILEMDGVSEKLAMECLERAARKFPFKTKIVTIWDNI